MSQKKRPIVFVHNFNKFGKKIRHFLVRIYEQKLVSCKIKSLIAIDRYVGIGARSTQAVENVDIVDDLAYRIAENDEHEIARHL